QSSARDVYAPFLPNVPPAVVGSVSLVKCPNRCGRGALVSRGKKLIALSLFTFIVLVVVGATFSGHGGDAAGLKTGAASDVITSQGLHGKEVPVSQVGINALASEAGHLRVSINFTWLLMTGYLVLFMQVG